MKIQQAARTASVLVPLAVHLAVEAVSYGARRVIAKVQKRQLAEDINTEGWLS